MILNNVFDSAADTSGVAAGGDRHNNNPNSIENRIKAAAGLNGSALCAVAGDEYVPRHERTLP